jgi:hypothetical protein
LKLRFFGASIQWRVIYALAASLLWWAIVELNQSWFGGRCPYPFYGTGAVYTALVLVPYLPDLRGLRWLRALALLLCGAFSYWSAVSLFDSSIIPMPDFVKGLSDGLYLSYPMGISGILGAAIVGIGARVFIPLALRWSGWLMLLGAGLLGGVALGFAASAGVGVDGNNSYGYWFPGHAAWQVLVCLALYYGSEHE